MMKNRLFPARPDRWWDWLASLLLIATMVAAATRLNATHWTEDLHVAQTVTLLGVIAGLALGYSFFSLTTGRIFALIYGVFVVVWQVGLTMGKGIQWQERLISMGNRLLLILDDIIRQKPVSDNLLFLVLMALLFWALSVYAGYSLTRHGNAWRGIVPAGLAMVIIHLRLGNSAAYLVSGCIYLSGAAPGCPHALSEVIPALETIGYLLTAIHGHRLGTPGFDSYYHCSLTGLDRPCFGFSLTSCRTNLAARYCTLDYCA
jgi:hypothetical protein